MHAAYVSAQLVTGPLSAYHVLLRTPAARNRSTYLGAKCQFYSGNVDSKLIYNVGIVPTM